MADETLNCIIVVTSLSHLGILLPTFQADMLAFRSKAYYEAVKLYFAAVLMNN